MPGAALGHSAGRAGAKGSPEVRQLPWGPICLHHQQQHRNYLWLPWRLPHRSRGCCELPNPQPTPTSAREHPTLWGGGGPRGPQALVRTEGRKGGGDGGALSGTVTTQGEASLGWRITGCRGCSGEGRVGAEDAAVSPTWGGSWEGPKGYQEEQGPWVPGGRGSLPVGVWEIRPMGPGTGCRPRAPPPSGPSAPTHGTHQDVERALRALLVLLDGGEHRQHEAGEDQQEPGGRSRRRSARPGSQPARKAQGRAGARGSPGLHGDAWAQLLCRTPTTLPPPPPPTSLANVQRPSQRDHKRGTLPSGPLGKQEMSEPHSPCPRRAPRTQSPLSSSTAVSSPGPEVDTSCLPAHTSLTHTVPAPLAAGPVSAGGAGEGTNGAGSRWAAGVQPERTGRGWGPREQSP